MNKRKYSLILVLLFLITTLFSSQVLFAQNEEENDPAVKEVVDPNPAPEVAQVPQPNSNPKEAAQPSLQDHIDKADFFNRLENPAVIFNQFSDEEVKEMFLGKVKGGSIEKFLKNNPKIVDFVVRCLKDDHAMKGFMQMRKDKDRLKTYIALMVAMFVLSLFLNRMGNKNKNFVERFLKRILVSISMFCISAITILLIFNKEITPFIRIFKQVFLQS